MEIKKIEKVFIIIAVFLLSDNLFQFLSRDQLIHDSFEGDTTKQAILFIIYVITISIVIFNRYLFHNLLKAIIREKWFMILIIIVSISILWSAFPELSLRRIVAMIGSTLFGLYLGVRFSREELINLLTISFLLIIIFNYFGILILSEYTVYSETRGEVWKGFFSHKNHLSRFSVLALLVLLLLFFCGGKKKKILTSVFIILAGILLIRGYSVTSYLTFLLIIILIPILRRFKLKSYLDLGLLSIFIAGLGGLSLWFIFNLENLLAVFNRDLSLTGRTIIWEASLTALSNQPILGYGFSGFWTGWHGPSAYVLNIFGKEINQAHNGFIDVALQIGLVGLIILLIQISMSLMRAIRLLIDEKATWLSLWPILYLFLFIMINIVENVLLRQNDLYWVIYVSTVISLVKSKESKSYG